MPRAPRPDAPEARVASLSPGRLRLRLPARRGDSAFFSHLSAEALMLPGVMAAAANPDTAGLLLRFRGEVGAVLDAAARQRLFIVPPQNRAPEPGGARAGRLGVLVLGGLAAVQAARGVLLPPAATLLWYAGSLLDGGADGGEE